MTLAQLQPRIDRNDFDKVAPGIGAALRALTKAVDDSGLDKPLTELLKVRASQINGCAFCLQYHLNLARQFGVPQAKLDLLPVWREAASYTERERAALAWTEALTQMGGHATDDPSESAYLQLQQHFSDAEISFLSAAVAAINAWNRIAGGLRFTPPPSA